MAQLLGIRIQNFKSLRDVTLGQVGHGQGEALPALMAFIGPNGSGKSTLLDAFGFLGDALREGVEAACDAPHRGGFTALRSQGATGPIQFLLYFRGAAQTRPITYEVSIDAPDGLPVVTSEVLKQRGRGQKHGRPFPFLRLENGAGMAWSGESSEGEESNESIPIELDDRTRLAITTLGQLKEHPRILTLRHYIENWYLSYFIPNAARTLPMSGAHKHLDRTGANLGNYMQYMERQHPEKFRGVLSDVAAFVPGIESVKTERSLDGRLLIEFNERGFKDPFFQANMSDGTLKLFAYYLLLNDPDPRPFVGIEEPENGLYHRLLPKLAQEFKRHAEQHNSTQMVITTHSPYLIDELRPDQVWLMTRTLNGSTQVRPVNKVPSVQAMVDEGIPLGSLWFSNHFHEYDYED